MYIRSDLSDERSVRELVQSTVGELGRLDGLVNNAMATDQIASSERPVAEMASDGFDRILKVGLYGMFWACKYSIAAMLKGGGGSIVNVSSVAGVAGVPSMPAYTVCKGGMSALARQIATDYSPRGIRVNTMTCGMILAPGLTDIIAAHPVVGPAMERGQLTDWGRREDVASMARYLLSDEARFITGADIAVDGGWTSASGIPNVAAVLAEEARALPDSGQRASSS
jgi:NAD(P)-dependent dehydrogenase (short-subunit alcohol dehydrogenase family)